MDLEGVVLPNVSVGMGHLPYMEIVDPNPTLPALHARGRFAWRWYAVSGYWIYFSHIWAWLVVRRQVRLIRKFQTNPSLSNRIEIVRSNLNRISKISRSLIPIWEGQTRERICAAMASIWAGRTVTVCECRSTTVRSALCITGRVSGFSCCCRATNDSASDLSAAAATDFLTLGWWSVTACRTSSRHLA